MTTLTAVAMVPVGTSPVCGTIRPDGAFLYVTNQGSNNVSVIDATNPPFPEVARPTVGTIPLFGGIRPDGAFLFVINRGSNNVTVIDTTSNTVVATIFLGWDLDPDLRLDFTADGNWVYVTNPVSNTVLAGDLVNLVVAPPISVGTRPTHVAIAQIGPF
jgi:YVTN family beta-propeller protein